LDVILSCTVVALLTGILVYLLLRRRISTVSTEAQAGTTKLAVASSQVEALMRERTEQASLLDNIREEARGLSNDRERLTTQLQQREASLTEYTTSLTDTKSQLRLAEADLSQTSTKLQVATANLAAGATRESSLMADFKAANTERQDLSRQVTSLTAGLAATEKECFDLRRRLEEQKAWFEEQTKQFEQGVLVAATKIMTERGHALTEANKSEVAAIVSPFKDQLAEFRQRVDAIYAADTNERGQLREQIVQLTSLNQTTSSETKRLINALTVSSKATGDWGETILERILEDSGLRLGKEYELQLSVKSAEGDRLQPDAVIFLPERRQVVVDAKVSNKAWTAYCGEGDEAVKASYLKDHLASLRAHIKGLSIKDYARSPDLQTVDFVLMFVPVEAALLTALAKDESLYVDAYRSKIILVTPSTLMAVLKLVEGIWTFQKRKESADKIAEAGRKLFEKLTVFANTFVDVGMAIGKAQDTFEKAQNQLATGKGHAIGLAQKLVGLGISPTPGKTMPAALLTGIENSYEEDGESDANAAGSC
jgi:DNA recombination protein RmuC